MRAFFGDPSGKMNGLKKIPLWCVIIFPAMLYNCVQNDMSPKFFTNMGIKYVLFNSDGTVLVTADNSSSEPYYFNPKTCTSIPRPDTFLGRFEKIKNNLGENLIIKMTEQKRTLFDVLDNSLLGSYAPENPNRYTAFMISPQKQYLIEWSRQNNTKTRKSRSNDDWYCLNVNSLALGAVIKTFEVSQKTHFYTDGRSNAPITFSDDDQWLVIVQNGKGLSRRFTEIYSTENFNKIKEIDASPWTEDIKISPDKRYLAEYSTGTGWFALRDLRDDGRKRIEIPKNTETFIFVDDTYAICKTNRQIYLLNCISGESNQAPDSILSKNVSYANGKLAYFSKKGCIKVVRIPTMKVVLSVKSHIPKSRGADFSHCGLSPNAEYMAIWNSGYVAVWSVVKRKLIGYLSKKS